MEPNTKRNQWIEEVISSTTGMKKAQPATDLYQKILSDLDKPYNTKVVRVPVKQWAAAAILLLAVNISSAIYFTTRESAPEKTNTTNPIAVEMQSASTYNY